MKRSGKTRAAGSFVARLTPTDERLRLDQFVKLEPTPRNVGVCMSGGGSRALSAGLGQLRALKELELDGVSLLGLAKAISTVSGGSWLTVPFVYLTEGTSDDDYLNLYVADPGRLVPSRTRGHSVAETLDRLPDGNVGEVISNQTFRPAVIALQNLILFLSGVPANLLWQTAIATHFLKSYGLFEPDADHRSTSFFTYDRATLDEVRRRNPTLENVTGHLVAEGPDRVRRPFLICNTSIFLDEPGTGVQYLAAVECTPFYTGVVGAPEGTDANGLTAGGGGVTSFAFNSNPTTVDRDDVQVDQERQWALSDIVGSSSAFYAAAVEDQLAIWRQDVKKMVEDILGNHEHLSKWIERHVHERHKSRAHRLIDKELLKAGLKAAPEGLRKIDELHRAVEDLKELVPEYAYWPVRDAAPAEETLPTRFADGGNLENTGLADLLSFDDVDSAIVFVNGTTPIRAGAMGVIDENGNEMPGTRVIVDGQVPGLFGYQPYDGEKGYLPYRGDDNPAAPLFRFNQLFKESEFTDFLRQIWRATGNSGDPAELGATAKEPRDGASRKAPLVRQDLELLSNRWFGIRGGRTVRILWCYLDRVGDWYDQLSPDVREILGPFDDLSSFHGFPHFSTFMIHLNATELNLLASLTSWCVAAPENRELFLEMFRE